MVLGMLLLGRRYSTTKYASVVMISLGILLCTIMSSKDVKKESTSSSNESDEEKATLEQDEPWEMVLWMVGISILTFALFLSARMGLYQEEIYAKFGKHPKEALYFSVRIEAEARKGPMVTIAPTWTPLKGPTSKTLPTFFQHCLPLPGFILLGSSIYSHLILALHSTPITFFGGSLQVPSTVVYIVIYVLTQYLCISSVYTLTSECSSLTVTLVVTLRKFLSLLFSILYFQNPFTRAHWVGTFLVFAGTLLFSDIPGMMRDQSGVKVKKS
jgi:solute carrier family 35 (UDP-xylose/UDP-N-acetylglucosamine transporter), member B4